MENLEKSKEKNPWEKLANELDELQKVKNDGRGVSHIKTLIVYLRRGDVESAKALCFNESDKFYGLEDIQEIIIKKLFQGKEHPWKLFWNPSKKEGK